MKKIISIMVFFASSILWSKEIMVKKLEAPPSKIEQFKEIATQYNDKLPDLWNSLTPQERIFSYYIYRASVPGNRIIADQNHRHALEIIDLFEKLIRNKESIKQSCAQMFNVDLFLSEAELFLVYLYTHHGQYFLKEFSNHKRTPENLKLTTLVANNIVKALNAIGVSDSQEIVDKLHKSLFDAQYEPTLTVEGSIEQSAINIYSPDFTQADFDALDPESKSAINAYFYLEKIDGKSVPKVRRYRIGDKYSDELEVAHFWLTKAHDFALTYPGNFDKNIPACLKHMLSYLETGNENDFRNFSIEWLKTTSRIDFNFGFVEVYHDPKSYRGGFEADLTIKAVDMEKLNALLPTLEKSLPFPHEFKRENLNDITSIPNASVNTKVFGSGDAGPMKFTAAYCLPNYEDIRSKYGSKQIIYQSGKGLGELTNPALALRLFSIKEHADWLEVNDPDRKFNNDIWDVHVVLHETLGHGSGRNDKHIFVEGDPLVIAGQQYKIGDIIPVTNENSTEFIGEHYSALEELRAEIIALYISIFNFDELNASGLYKDWTKKIGKEKLIEWFILHMAKTGLARLMFQADNATEISQAHARANTTIMNYLIDHGGLELVEEIYLVNEVEHIVIDLRLTDLEKAKQAVKDLACLVQRYKSTADRQAIDELMKKYGICVRHPEHIKLLKANRQAVQGDLKEIAEIFPSLTPEFDESNNIVDISAFWPKSFLEQQFELSVLALSKE